MLTRRSSIVLMSTALFVACKGKPNAAGVAGDASATPSQSASASAHVISPAEAIHANPNLLVPVSEDWVQRIGFYVSDGLGSDACGEKYKITGSDEFERRDSKQKADAACKNEMDKAVAFLSRCPALMSIAAHLDSYDFGKKEFPVRLSDRTIMVSNEGHFDLNGDALLLWPGMSATGDEGGIYGAMCESDQSMQARNAIAAAIFHISVADEGKAKAARAASPSKLEFAFIYDGKSSADHFPCGYNLTHPKPTGLVVAWRMMPSFDWTTAATGWTPPPTCDDARTFFSAAPTSTTGGQPADAATLARAAVHQGTVTVDGHLASDVIQKVVGQKLAAFKVCYTDGLRKNGALHGGVKVKFIIGRDGSVQTSKDDGSDLADQGVVQCVVRRFENLTFPQPEGGIVTVVYPLTFATDKQ